MLKLKLNMITLIRYRGKINPAVVMRGQPCMFNDPYKYVQTCRTRIAHTDSADCTSNSPKHWQ